MKILVVDNGGQWTHREWRVLKYLGVDTSIIPNTTPLEMIDADGLVLSGGAPRIGEESAKLGEIGTYLDKASFPMLGICVSHQFMAVHFGGAAGPGEMPEYGKVMITIDGESPLFKGVPGTFTAWQSHNDEVKKLPDCFKALAHSDTCKVQAMQHVNRPLFGLQFHPEVEHTENGELMFKNFIEACKK